MIEVYQNDIVSKDITGLYHLKLDLPKVRDSLEKNFIAKWQSDGLVFGVYHYQNSFDKFALKLIEPTNSNTFKIISVSDLQPLNGDGEKLFKAMRDKSSTQGIFNFTFHIASTVYSLSIYLNSIMRQFFVIITKPN